MPSRHGSRKYDALNRIDPDAAAFIRLTSATDRQGINNFVVGAKQRLGLWSLIRCYPAAGNQNYNTGTLVAGLGGLSAWTATIVNGGTWNPLFVDLDGANNRYLSHSSVVQLGSATFFAAVRCPNASRYRTLFDVNTVSSNRTFVAQPGPSLNIEAGSGGTTINAAGVAPSNQFFTYGISVNGTSSHTALNGTVVARSFASNPTGSELPIIGNNLGTFATSVGQLAFYAYIQSPIGTQLADLHTLYASTLGRNLGI